MANWWVVVSDPGQQDAVHPAGASVVSTTPGSAADKALFSVTGPASIGGKTVYRYMGPFGTQAEAQAALKQGASSVPLPSPIPGVSVPGATITPGGQVQSNVIPGLQQIGAFFSSLSQASTWIRVAEVLAGLVLIAVGVARITGTQNIISKAVRATPAGKAAKLL